MGESTNDQSKKHEEAQRAHAAFFAEKDFLKRFDLQMKLIRTAIIKTANREGLKNNINSFAQACFSRVKKEDFVLHMHIEFFQTLNYYAELFENDETFENVIKTIETPDLWNRLFSKKPIRSSLVYGETLLKYYGIQNDRNQGWYTPVGFEMIQKAKYYIFKAYSQIIEGKNKATDSDFSYCLVLLSACFMHLARWFEPIFYLRLLKKKSPDDMNIKYLTALTLDELKEKSCLDFNGQLLLKIMDHTSATIENPRVEERQIVRMKEVRERCEEDLKKKNCRLKGFGKNIKEYWNSKENAIPILFTVWKISYSLMNTVSFVNAAEKLEIHLKSELPIRTHS